MTAPTRIGINGFGRIGRQVFRSVAERHPEALQIVAVNDLADPAQLAHLLKYDSTYGRYPGSVAANGAAIQVDGRDVLVFSHRSPSDIPWSEIGAELVVESTGFFTDGAVAAGHLNEVTQKVIISAPASNEDLTVVLGINEDHYDPARHNVISNASCTTNCVAPMAKVLHDAFTIEQALMSTIHSYTNDQRILDQVHEDPRRARAAATSIIPTTTGAARAVTRVVPELAGKIDGMAYRVPTITGSVTDLTARLSQAASVEDINAAYREAAGGRLAGLLAVSDEPLVSADYVGDPSSCTIDALSTAVIHAGDNPFVKVVGWYDNEWGYACRTADLAQMVAKSL